MRFFLLFLALLALCGCASTDVRMAGGRSYAALGPTESVRVIPAAEIGGVRFELLAAISHSDPGKYQQLSLKDALIPMKEKAREIGANGLIIDSENTIYSGIVSRGIHVEGRAIRLE